MLRPVRVPRATTGLTTGFRAGLTAGFGAGFQLVLTAGLTAGVVVTTAGADFGRAGVSTLESRAAGLLAGNGARGTAI